MEFDFLVPYVTQPVFHIWILYMTLNFSADY